MSRHAALEPISQLVPANARYPAALSVLGDRAPASLALLGNVDLLGECSLALFCSVKCSGSLILKTCDLAQKLRDTDATIISGFHSPVERECLNALLDSRAKLIVCPARGLESMRIPKEYRDPIEQGRLLLISPFTEKRRQPDAQMAERRNRLVAALADRVFIAYAAPSSKTERFCREILAWKKPVYTFDHEANRHLIEMGVRALPQSKTGEMSTRELFS